MIRNDDQKYGRLSKILHWLIAGLMLFLIWLGWYMTGLTYYAPFYYQSINLHKAFGLVVLMLLCAKIIWLAVSPMPKPDRGLKRWEYIAASLTHKILWGLIALLPVTGYMISTSAGAPVSFFGFFDIPAIVDISVYLRDMAIDYHYYLAYGGCGIIALHMAAALKHHFINKDQTLKRMV